MIVTSGGDARDLPLFVSGCRSFPRLLCSSPIRGNHAGASARLRPYKVGKFEPGRYIEYERVKDWWGTELPVARGQNNFDVIRYEYYRDRDVAFEGFTSKTYLFREELVSRVWATRYDLPAVRDGRVKRDVIPDHTPSAAQGWFFNTRREKFKDKRVREAFINAFDFEWTNATIMYGAYQRTHSVFQNSDMMAVGKPSRTRSRYSSLSAAKLLRKCSAEPYLPPVSDGSGQDRALLRRATALLQEAGCVIKDGKRVTPQGEPITVEFLIDDPVSQPHHNTFHEESWDAGDRGQLADRRSRAISKTGG